MRQTFLAALTLPILIFASVAQGTTVSDLVGRWELTDKSCVAVVGDSDVVEEVPFLPMPSRLTLKFTSRTLTVDATYYGCVYRLKGPFHLSGDRVRLHTDKAVNQCNGDIIDVPVEPFKVQAQGQRLEVSGLLKSARLCPPSQVPTFSFRKY